MSLQPIGAQTRPLISPPPAAVWAKAGAERSAEALTGRPKDGADDKTLRRRLGEFAGTVFYTTLIEEMQKTTFETEFMHGGRGEKAFRGQLAQQLGKSLGASRNDPVTNHLYEAARKRQAAATGRPKVEAAA